MIRPRPRHVHGKMNKTERRYAELLDQMILSGEIVRYKFERIKFKLADNTFYTPDFVITYHEHMEIHEVKGFWRDDARVKIKVAAEQNPEYLWKAVQWKKKEWVYEEF